MPTHEELPDPEAWWRLTGDEDVAPAAAKRATGRYDAVVIAIIVAILGFLTIDIVGSDPLYDAMAWFYEFMNGAPGWPGVFVFLFVGAYPVVLLHELGHAAAARSLLGTPVSIAVGSVGKLAQVRLGEITMSLHAIASPARVEGSATFDTSRATARDILLIALAGPVTSAAGLLVAVPALAAVPSHGIVHGLLWAVVGTSFFGVLNLIPLTLQEGRDGPTVQTDGRLALDAARVLRSLR